MKFELSTNYKLAFRLLNEGATLAAWIDRGIHRDIGKVDKSAITHNIAISANQRIYRYLPTIYDAFALDCERFNIEFLIDVNDVEQDLRDRSR